MKNALRTAIISLAALSALSALPAVGSAETFNTTGSMVDNGTYGNVLKFTPTDTSSALRLQVTGWQSNQDNNAITSAYVGAYGPGMGVTGIGDLAGGSNYHQIDNAKGYTDFVLLQFNAPVILSGVNLASFLLGSATTKDNDFGIYAANIPTANWNSAIDLTKYVTVPSIWTSFSGAGQNGLVSTKITTASSQWLIGAAFNSGGNDGFKIASITVTPTAAVPEPASWAMMIVGLGMVGFALRARRQPAALPVRSNA